LRLGEMPVKKYEKTYLYTDSNFFCTQYKAVESLFFWLAKKIQFERHYALMRNCSKALYLYEMRLQGIMVVLFIILDWIFVSMNKTTMIPCGHVS